jgi:hypothetical protein
MSDRHVLLYFAWSRPGETGAPLTEIEDRFPALFELRRLFYPKFEELADSLGTEQGIGGFLDHVQKPNFAGFAEHAQTLTGRAAMSVERMGDDGQLRLLDRELLAGIDTVLVISFDSLRTRQSAAAREIEAVHGFLSSPDHLIAVCPHHDIGAGEEGGRAETRARQLAEHLHHGDRAIPPRQAFGGFARTLLAGLGVPVQNRFGLRPAVHADGSPAAIEVEEAADRLGLLRGVESFNLHPHLPHLERLGECAQRMDVLARQPIDLHAPAHPFTREGRRTFDALLQSRPETFPGTLLVSDTTLWSATAGGLEGLTRLWSNVLTRGCR